MIDKDGVIRRKLIGAIDWTNPEIVTTLTTYSVAFGPNRGGLSR